MTTLKVGEYVVFSDAHLKTSENPAADLNWSGRIAEIHKGFVDVLTAAGIRSLRLAQIAQVTKREARD